MAAPSKSSLYLAIASAISLILMNSSAEWEREDSQGPSLNEGKCIRAWSLRVGLPNGFMPMRPQIHPDRPSGDHRRPSVPQARPDRPKKDQNNKHDGRPSRRGQNSQVDKDRHENRRITPSGRDVRRGNGKKEKDSDRSGGSNKSNSKERTAVRMRTV